VGRMGGNYYVRANGQALFEVEKPLDKPALGIDGLPASLRHSPVLTGNELGKLGSVEAAPGPDELLQASADADVKAIMETEILTADARLEKLHLLIRRYLADGRKREALAAGYLFP